MLNGGQVGDKGVISSENGEFLVEDTAYLTPQIIAHHGKVIRGIIRRGEKVKAEVDRERRLDIARNHTATPSSSSGPSSGDWPACISAGITSSSREAEVRFCSS